MAIIQEEEKQKASNESTNEISQVSVNLLNEPMKSCCQSPQSTNEIWQMIVRLPSSTIVFFMNSVSKSQIFIWKSDIADLEVEDGPTQKFLKIECFE